MSEISKPKEKKLELPQKIKLGRLELNLTEVAKALISLWASPKTALKHVLVMLKLQLPQASPQELAWVLINSALLRATANLLRETTLNKKKIEELNNKFKSTSSRVLEHSKTDLVEFFDKPKSSEIVKNYKEQLLKWAIFVEISEEEAQALVNRLGDYLVESLHDCWRENAEEFARLDNFVNTPFKEKSQDQRKLNRYKLYIRNLDNHSIFGETFGLREIYMPLRGYYEKIIKEKKPQREELRELKREKIAVYVEEKLKDWVKAEDKDDAIRVISGGPGSGKSSFLKVFAANISKKLEIPILFIPLHLFSFKDDLITALDNFVSYNPHLDGYNPVSPNSSEKRILLIFDGLDELSIRGKGVNQAVEDFVRDVQEKIRDFNQKGSNRLLQVILSGRTLAVQGQEQKAFRKAGLIFQLLPYYIKKDNKKEYVAKENNLYDQRNEWWQKFSKLKGKSFEGLPKELQHDDDHQLTELTSQPLLNYIIGLSYIRGKVDFSEQTNLNEVYFDLIESVHRRDYEDKPAIEIKREDFLRFLEVVGLSAWHSGDTRTTTIKEIEAKVPSESWFRKILEPYKEHADGGCTKLLTGFYFRKAGQKDGGEDTFEFTHKSFGEYLTARRIVGSLEHIHDKLEASEGDFEPDWTPKKALIYWAKTCGPTKIDRDLLDFLRREIKLKSKDITSEWQETIIKLINYVFEEGMPMLSDELKINSYKEATRQANNAEEALLATHSTCALITNEVSRIPYLDKSEKAFGDWMHKTCGQLSGNFNVFLASLNHLNLSSQNLYLTNLEGAYLGGAYLGGACLEGAYLGGAYLGGAYLGGAYLGGANLGGAYLEGAYLEGAYLEGASLGGANLRGASLGGANLGGASLRGANLGGANLGGANLVEVKNLDKAHNVPKDILEEWLEEWLKAQGE